MEAPNTVAHMLYLIRIRIWMRLIVLGVFCGRYPDIQEHRWGPKPTIAAANRMHSVACILHMLYKAFMLADQCLPAYSSSLPVRRPVGYQLPLEGKPGTQLARMHARNTPTPSSTHVSHSLHSLGSDLMTCQVAFVVCAQRASQHGREVRSAKCVSLRWSLQLCVTSLAQLCDSARQHPIRAVAGMHALVVGTGYSMHAGLGAWSCSK
jgi:hypothetical protein